MCKASIFAERWRFAEEGELLSIGITKTRHGAFHEPGVPVNECVVCTKTGDRLSVTIPPLLQQQYGLAPIEEAVFWQTPGSDSQVIQDQVVFVKHPKRPSVALSLLAAGGATAVVLSVVDRQSSDAEVIDEILLLSSETEALIRVLGTGVDEARQQEELVITPVSDVTIRTAAAA